MQVMEISWTKTQFTVLIIYCIIIFYPFKKKKTNDNYIDRTVKAVDATQRSNVALPPMIERPRELKYTSFCAHSTCVQILLTYYTT